MNTETDHVWNIEHITNEAPEVVSLYLTSKTARPTFTAGQYVTIKLPGFGPAEGKSYTISSAPHEDHIRITIKKMGAFSTALFNLKEGDELTTSEPYGFFYPEPEDTTDIVFIVGGIGITPCLSVIKHLIYTKDLRRIQLIYSNQTAADIVFKNELDNLAKTNAFFSVNYHVTRETSTTKDFISGRITPPGILKSVSNLEQTDFFICGSIDFTKSVWKELKEAGVPQHQLYTEGFF